MEEGDGVNPQANRNLRNKGNDITSDKITIEHAPTSHILYHVDDLPPIAATLLFALQVCAQSVTPTVTNAVLISEAICGSTSLAARLMSTSMFMAGLTTLIQSVIGVRLPLFQVSAFYYVAPILSRAELADWACAKTNIANQTTSLYNITGSFYSDMGQEGWKIKLMEANGVLIVVSVIHALIGALGLGGYIKRVISPLTLVPPILCILIYIVSTLIKFVLVHVGAAAFTVGVLVILTTYMSNTLVPLPMWTPSRGFFITRSRFLKTYAVLISIILGWILCHILTIAGALPDDPSNIQYEARTDTKGEAVELASWFYFPYPGQFGMPQFSLILFFGLLVSMISSVLDSLADYELTSRICHIPEVPTHAVNRGLLIEGFCSILSGGFGAGLATSTFITCTGSLAITGVTSRRVFQVSGILLICLGVVGKLGALFVIIPKPVLGGVMLVISGSITGVILAELNDYDMKRPRNCMTVGLPILLGSFIPRMITENQHMFDTGIAPLNNVILALCGSHLFVAGVAACVLDNTLPGGRKRIKKPGEDMSHLSKTKDTIHNVPYLHDFFLQCKWTKYCPFLPSREPSKQEETDISGL